MDLKELDSLMNVAIINFYTLGKNGEPLLLVGINPKDKRHLACVHIAKLIKDIYQFQFYLPRYYMIYWRLSWKCKSNKWLKPITKKAIKVPFKLVDVEDFISHIENANEKPGAFAELYDEYYKEYDR